MERKKPLASSSLENRDDVPPQARCHTAPAKSLSALDDLYDQYAVPFPTWGNMVDMEGDYNRVGPSSLSMDVDSLAMDGGSSPDKEDLVMATASSAALSLPSPSVAVSGERRTKPQRRPKVPRAAEKTDLPRRVFVGGLTLDVGGGGGGGGGMCRAKVFLMRAEEMQISPFADQ